MKTLFFPLQLVSALVGLLFASAPAKAQLLVSDTFTHADGRFIPFSGTVTTYAPSPTNILGGVYVVTGGGDGDGKFLGNTGQMHNGGGVGLAMGSYNDNATLTVSADLSFLNVTVPVQISGYALLGFFSAQSTAQYNPGSARTNFTGLQVSLDGSISLYLQGTLTGSAIAYGGTYNPAAMSTLTYTVNTTTGAISNITFGASSASYSFATTGFTQARTEFVGFGGSLNNTPNWVAFDNFTVTAVPEPTAVMLAMGGMGLLGLRRRRRTLG